jgi:XisI protein
MEKLDHYRQCIQTLLMQHDSKPVQADIETELIFDLVRDRYLLMRVGWNGLSRVYHSILHFDLKDNKIWLQQNMTDADVAQALIEMGVSETDIVLGLHPPYKRPYTGYSVA